MSPKVHDSQQNLSPVKSECETRLFWQGSPSFTQIDIEKQRNRIKICPQMLLTSLLNLDMSPVQREITCEQPGVLAEEPFHLG